MIFSPLGIYFACVCLFWEVFYFFFKSMASVQFSSVQSLSRVRLFATPWIAERQASLSITISRSSLKLTSVESAMPSSHLILCCPLFLLPPIPPSIRVFSNESTLRTRWPKYWSFSFSVIPSKEIPGLISFRMDWLDLLAVQGTLKSLLQPHSSKASILQRSAFFTVQLSHPYMTTGKTIALTRRTFYFLPIQLWFMLHQFSHSWKVKRKNKSVSHSVMFGSLWTHDPMEPSRLLCSWDSPGKNTGVGYHFLLQLCW